MDRWSIFIDIEGFRSTYTKDTQAVLSLGALMEGILSIGSRCYPESAHRLFAHQLGDGFVIVGEFGRASLKQPTAVAIALLRTILSAGGVAKAAISEGQLADIVGCYPKTIQDLYYCAQGGPFPIGRGRMTVLPVMGTALINSFKVLHSEQTLSGSLLILPKSLAPRVPKGVPVQEVGEFSLIDWIHASFAELSAITCRAQLPNPDEATMKATLNRYIKRNEVGQDWTDNTKKYLQLEDGV